MRGAVVPPEARALGGLQAILDWLEAALCGGAAEVAATDGEEGAEEEEECGGERGLEESGDERPLSEAIDAYLCHQRAVLDHNRRLLNELLRAPTRPEQKPLQKVGESRQTESSTSFDGSPLQKCVDNQLEELAVRNARGTRLGAADGADARERGGGGDGMKRRREETD